MAIDEAREYTRQYGQVVARAWADEAFKRRLLSAPAAVLAEHGIELPPGIEVRVHENTAAVIHFTLPPPPSDELSDEQLDGVAGGDTAGTAGTVGSLGTACSCFSTASSVGTAGTAS